MPFRKEILNNEEGSALATVLVIAVIVSLFIGAILSGILLQLKFLQRDIDSAKALYAAEEGIHRYLFENRLSIEHGSTQQIVLSNGEVAEVTASLFGGFLEVHSVGKEKTQTREIQVLVGDKEPWIFKNAIVIGDSTSELTVTGTTIVKGDILISNGGVKTDNFKGVPFSGNLDGTFKPFQADSSFPSLRMEHFTTQEAFFEEVVKNKRLEKFSSSSPINRSNITSDTLYYKENMEWNSTTNIELPRESVIIVNGNLLINGKYSLGDFTKIIVSDTLIVEGDVSGKNILLFAGKDLQVGGNVALSAQILSKGNIQLKDNSYLMYPSVLYSSKEFYDGGEREVIHIKDQAIIDGTILYPIQVNNATRNLMRVKIDATAIVRGGIFTMGQTELAGSVYGSVLTYQVYFYESPTNYINWLKDIEIDVTKRPEHYIAPLGFSDTTKHVILDWYELEN